MTRSSSTFSSWLAGVRVLDFTAVLAGPHLSRVLAQAGAEVIKIEPPGRGDSTRALPYRYGDGQSGYFNQQNLGKRSVAVDLSTKCGQEIALSLAQVSQVVVENFRPGVTRALGVDYESIERVRADIVYASISGWGQTGPYAAMAGEVRSTTALSGLTACDHTGRIPRTERTSFADMNASIHTVAAVGAGLYRARRTGRGCHIDVALLEALISTNALELAESLMAPGRGLDGQEERVSGDHARVASGSFRCADGRWVYVRALHPLAWAALVRLLGLCEEYRAMKLVSRRAVAAEVYGRLAEYCGAAPAGQVVDVLRDIGISATEVTSVRDVLQQPSRVRDAGLVQDLQDPSAGAISVPAGLFATDQFNSTGQRRAPLLGEHTRAVLTEVLHRAPAEVDRLVRAGVVEEADAARREG